MWPCTWYFQRPTDIKRSHKDRDGQRDHHHVGLLAKYEILSTDMHIVEGAAVDDLIDLDGPVLHIQSYCLGVAHVEVRNASKQRDDGLAVHRGLCEI